MRPTAVHRIHFRGWPSSGSREAMSAAGLHAMLALDRFLCLLAGPARRDDASRLMKSHALYGMYSTSRACNGSKGKRIYMERSIGCSCITCITFLLQPSGHPPTALQWIARAIAKTARSLTGAGYLVFLSPRRRSRLRRICRTCSSLPEPLEVFAEGRSRRGKAKGKETEST